MKTKEKQVLPLRTEAVNSPSRALPTPPTGPNLEPATLDARLINFSRSTPLLLNLERGKAHPRDLAALSAHVQDSFPELLTLRGKLQRTTKRRDDLTQTMMLFLRGNYPQLAALMGDDTDPKNEQRNSVVDHSARLMWDLSQAEERFNALAAELNELERALEEATEAPYQRFVRWAIRESR